MKQRWRTGWVLGIWALLLFPIGTLAFDGPFGPWANEDIGPTGIGGRSACTNGIFSIRGAGEDIWGATDAFHYAYRPFAGDCAMVVRVTQVGNVDSFSRAGIMFRASLDANSPHAFILYRAGGRTAFQARLASGTNTWTDGSWVYAPYWVKLVRVGNTFSGYESADGTNWTLVATTNIDTAETIFVGLAVTSHK